MNQPVSKFVVASQSWKRNNTNNCRFTMSYSKKTVDTCFDAATVFTVPNRKDLHSRSNLAHTVVQREAATLSHPSSVTCTMQHPTKLDDQLLMYAEKDKKTGFYLIFTDREMKNLVGKLGLERKTRDHVVFLLVAVKTASPTAEDIPVASVAYHVHSPWAVLCKNPTRHATIMIPKETWVLDDDSSGKKNSSWYQRTHFEEKMLQSQDMFLLLESKQPRQNPDGSYSLSMNGRGKKVSSKNMQLVEVMSNESSQTNLPIVCQFAKVDDTKFHLDFSTPFSPFIAFGFALAQLSL